LWGLGLFIHSFAANIVTKPSHYWRFGCAILQTRNEFNAHLRGSTMDDMNNVAPVNHGVLSTTGNVALGAAGGALKTGFTSAALWTIGATVIGGGVAALIALSPLAIGLGIVGGGILGLFTSGFAGVIGSAIGGVKGASRSVQRVNAEQGAANVLQAQVAAYQAQAMAQAPANDNKYNFPAQGSAMNPAMASIQADSAQGFGPIAGQGLQRA
jgi:hypothetical protein